MPGRFAPRSLTPAVAACAVVAALAGTNVPATAQAAADRSRSTAKASAGTETPRVDRLPVSLDRIREALERAPESRLKLPDRPTFFVKIEGRTPRIEDFIDVGQLGRGPSQPAPLVHQEFLALVTPAEVRPFASFSSGELAVVSAQALATGLAFNALPSLIKEGLRRRREERAKREVADLLAELERQRREDPGSPRQQP